MKTQPNDKTAIASWIKLIMESCKTQEQLDSAWELKLLYEKDSSIPKELIKDLDNYYKEKKIHINEK